MGGLGSDLLERFQQAASELDGLDRAAYTEAKRDQNEPIFGLGPANASIAFFGRDPGREEIKHGVPFIGAGGQQIRRVLHQRARHSALATTEQAIAAGIGFFWANTVPYKPLGNKAWSMAVKRRFQPLVATVLLDYWHGHNVITLGREAFFWFAIGQSAAVAKQLAEHWQQAERFERVLPIRYQGPKSASRAFVLHPLPHPSPLNATWFKHFPRLLEQRLNQLEAG